MNDSEYYRMTAEIIEELRETLNAFVAAFVTDGFTDREARALTVHLITGLHRRGEA